MCVIAMLMAWSSGHKLGKVCQRAGGEGCCGGRVAWSLSSCSFSASCTLVQIVDAPFCPQVWASMHHPTSCRQSKRHAQCDTWCWIPNPVSGLRPQNSVHVLHSSPPVTIQPDCTHCAACTLLNGCCMCLLKLRVSPVL